MNGSSATDTLAVEGFATPATPAPTPRQLRFLAWMSDTLIYVVVINLFVEYAPTVIIESFTISVLTAIVLKLLLDGLIGLEHAVSAWFVRRGGGIWRVLNVLSRFLILFLSKFVVLEVTYLVFRGRVELGGFVAVAALVLAMIATRGALRLVYFRLLASGGAAPASQRA